MLTGLGRHAAFMGSTSWTHWLMVWALTLVAASGCMWSLAASGIVAGFDWSWVAGLGAAMLIMRIGYRAAWRFRRFRDR